MMAPVLALSHVGIAMGGLGSDAAIESADVVIQNDQPSKVATAITIGRKTPYDCPSEYHRGTCCKRDCAVGRCIGIRHVVGGSLC